MNTKKPYIALVCILILGSCDNSKDLNYVSVSNSDGIEKNIRTVTLYDKANSPENYKANRYLKEGKYIEAEKIYREIISVSPKEHVAYHGLGSALYFQERYKEAEEMYQKAIELNPKFSISYSALGAIESTFGNLEIALEYYNDAIKAEPQNVEGYDGRAKIYIKLGQMKLATADLEKVIDLAPNTALSEMAKKRIYRLNRRTKPEIGLKSE